MRMRHTSRTDPQMMKGDRKQVSFRLDEEHRTRMKEILALHHPDLHTASDIMEDAVWLWFKEYDMSPGGLPERENGRDGTRNGAKEAGHIVRAPSTAGEAEVERVEVGEAS